MAAETATQFLQANLLNLFALVWFLLCFRGYLSYTGRRNLDAPSLAHAMHLYRRQWIRNALRRENRITASEAYLSFLDAHVRGE